MKSAIVVEPSFKEALLIAVGAVENPELATVKTIVRTLMSPFASAATVTSPIFPAPPTTSPDPTVEETETVGFDPTKVMVGAATLGEKVVVVVPDVYLT